MWVSFLYPLQPTCVTVASFSIAAAAAAKSLQSCLTLCDPIDGSPPGSPVPGILKARTLEWVAISFSNAWKWRVKVKSLSSVRLLATPWTAAPQAPASMGFSRQEYWSGVPLPSSSFTTMPSLKPWQHFLKYQLLTPCIFHLQALQFLWTVPNCLGMSKTISSLIKSGYFDKHQ